MEHQPGQSRVHDPGAQQLHTYIHDVTLDASQVSQAVAVPSVLWVVFVCLFLQIKGFYSFLEMHPYQ